MVKRNRKKVRKVSTVFFDQETIITDTQIEKYEGGGRYELILSSKICHVLERKMLTNCTRRTYY